MTNRRFPMHLQVRKQRQAGFTLIELLVALIAGMLVAAAAFAFSKSATRYFSQEARIASTQMSVLSGFQRLQNDIARASYLSTPNMPRDRDFHRVCAPDFATWQPLMKTLAGVQITAGTSAFGGAVKLPDDKYPDSIRIAGSFAAADMFPIANVETLSGGGSKITLGQSASQLARAGVARGSQDSMKAVFKPGRVLRILDMDGNMEFGLITDADYPSAGDADAGDPDSGSPWIKTKDVIPVKGTNSPTCGVGGYGTQSQASVVSLIEYAIVKVSAMSGGNADIYKKTIYSEAGSAYGDDSRTELVRREIMFDVDTPAITSDPNVEIVAEYGVDLRFGLWVGSATGAGLTYIAPSDSTIYTRAAIADNATYTEGTAPTGPESIRAIEARLAVRSREVDRGVMIDPALTGTSADGGYMYRFPLPGNVGVARVRTLVANIALENQRGDAW